MVSLAGYEFQSAVAHELISNRVGVIADIAQIVFQSAVAHELISNVEAQTDAVIAAGFKALSRMSSFPTGGSSDQVSSGGDVSKRCRA